MVIAFHDLGAYDLSSLLVIFCNKHNVFPVKFLSRAGAKQNVALHVVAISAPTEVPRLFYGKLLLLLEPCNKFFLL